MRSLLPGLVLGLFLMPSCSGDSAPGGGRPDAGTGGGGAGSGGDASGSGGAASGGVATGGAATGGVPGSGGGRVGTGGASTGGASSIWKPAVRTSWQWQLSGTLDTSPDVEMYDIDLEGTPAATIAALQAQGRRVVCYFDTAYEPYRADSALLEPYRGNPMDGWPGQYWLDIRASAVVDVMKARIAVAANKGCDGVEADDVDSRSNDPGFPITAADQRGFIRALAEESHRHALAFGLKNALEDVTALLDVADFAINEECFEWDECDQLKPFIDAGKPVFHVEYTEGDLATKGGEICPRANSLNFNTLIKHLDLDAPRFACR